MGRWMERWKGIPSARGWWRWREGGGAGAGAGVGVAWAVAPGVGWSCRARSRQRPMSWETPPDQRVPGPWRTLGTASITSGLDGEVRIVHGGWASSGAQEDRRSPGSAMGFPRKAYEEGRRCRALWRAVRTGEAINCLGGRRGRGEVHQCWDSG